MNNAAPHSLSAWSLIAEASPLVKLVLLLLLFASVITWALIFTKSRMVKQALAGNHAFLETFWNAKALDEVQGKIESMEHAPLAKVFSSGYKELRKLPAGERTQEGIPEVTNIERALNRAQALELDHLEKHVEWLASTASAAPFIGLFGTVWGIMNSFQNIGATGAASLAVVAPGISEALIATAVGLAAAIPAAIAYNYFIARIKRISLDLETFSQEFLNMVQRSLLTGRKTQAGTTNTGGTTHGNEQPSQ